MSRHGASFPASYFTGLYADGLDPWGFATSPYEQAKYDATLECLPRPRYASAFEVGCSIGVLSHRLADRCDALVACDVVPRVLDAARMRCADRPWVRFREGAVPVDWPDGAFDLILLSEVVYYLSPADVAALAARVEGALMPGGDVVLVHWLGETDYPLSGNEAAELFIARAASFAEVIRQIDAGAYRIDVLRARPA